jgi:hypothetical protein
VAGGDVHGTYLASSGAIIVHGPTFTVLANDAVVTVRDRGFIVGSAFVVPQLDKSGSANTELLKFFTLQNHLPRMPRISYV